MKVVYLARFLPAEGSTLHLYALAEGMVRRGHAATVVSAGPGPDSDALDLYRASIDAGVGHVRIGFPLRPTFTTVGKLRQFGRYMCVLPAALAALHRARPDVIHVHYPVTSYIAVIFSRLSGTPTVVTHHAMGITRHPLNRRVQAAIAISQELHDELTFTYGYAPDAVTTIFNGVDRHKFQPPSDVERRQARSEYGIDESTVLIGFVGRLNEVKGVDLLLEASGPILGPAVHLVLVGGTSEEAAGLIGALPDNVRRYIFHRPFTSNVREAYAALDICALASRREGFALSSVEAMMMGLPVVRSRTGGADTQVLDRTTGILVPVNDVLALRAALQELVSMSPEQRRGMGRLAAERASRMFSSQGMIEKTFDLYSRLLARRS
ncbi:glycosyltransferase family 4 protein [Ornithinimicrobium sp. W1679]|uniref:glycosyltransferase family 4 protein n=1 Tax=Ornithinimicrobium sp. W1679 TaxID=3418770 RepID=UPI003CFA5170